MISLPHKRKGYSVMELVIYIAIFSIFTIVIIQGLITVTKTYTQAGAYRHIASDAELAMERVAREIRGATSIDMVTSAFGSNPSALALNTTDINGAAKTVSFEVTDGVLELTENGTVTGALTSNRTNVTNFTLSIITTPVGNAVRIILTLETASGVPMSQTFYNTAILRSAY